MKEFLQTQEILRRCFVNVTNTLKVDGFYNTQDYFRAVYDETKDALRVYPVGGGGTGNDSYWGDPVSSSDELPSSAIDGTITPVINNNEIVFYQFNANEGEWVELLSKSVAKVEVQSNGVTLTDVLKKINFIGFNVVVGEDGTINISLPFETTAPFFNEGTAVVQDYPTSNRYVAKPTSNGSPFDIGNWISSNVAKRKVTKDSTITFSTGDVFHIPNLNTTFEMSILNSENQVIQSESFILDKAKTFNGTYFIATVSDWDNDRDGGYKANISIVVKLANILVDGGRFNVQFRHIISEEQIKAKIQKDLFFDADKNKPEIENVDIVVKTPVYKYLSGFKYYDAGTVFTYNASNIKNLLDSTFNDNVFEYSIPFLGNVTGIVPYNQMTNYTGLYNDVLKYSKDFILSSGIYTEEEVIVSGRTKDWQNGNWVNSENKKFLINSLVGETTELVEDFTTESYRLKDDYDFWDSTESLEDNDGLMVGGNGNLFYPNDKIENDQIETNGYRSFIRSFNDSNISHSNGEFLIEGNITEQMLDSEEVKIEVSLDGKLWWNAGKTWWGTFEQGDGIRIFEDEYILPKLKFTFGTKYTYDDTGKNGWGVYTRISIKKDSNANISKISMIWNE